jgi:hypothetical protein
MNSRLFCVLTLVLFSALAAVSVARPTMPHESMTVVLPAEFKQGVRLPLKLTFKFSTAEDRAISTGDVNCVLLGEDGQQVGGGDLFDLADSNVKTVLRGKEPSFEPAVKFDPYHTEIVVGKKYQIVCTWKYPGGELAGSAWFTLTK